MNINQILILIWLALALVYLWGIRKITSLLVKKVELLHNLIRIQKQLIDNQAENIEILFTIVDDLAKTDRLLIKSVKSKKK